MKRTTRRKKKPDLMIAPLDPTGDVIDRLAVEWLMGHLTPEEQDILRLWIIDELNFTEIGKLVGRKYRGRELTGSAIRYHKDRILARLQQYRTAMGVE